MNPQFQVTVTLPESKDEGLLVVAVMQRDDRKRRRETGSELNYIGYWIFEVRRIYSDCEMRISCTVIIILS